MGCCDAGKTAERKCLFNNIGERSKGDLKNLKEGKKINIFIFLFSFLPTCINI